MGLESLVNSGFPRGTVEMRKARLRALTHIHQQMSSHFLVLGRNEESPIEGIDTQLRFYGLPGCLLCRNEESPIEGIDTNLLGIMLPLSKSVEMRKARLRALTQPISKGL